MRNNAVQGCLSENYVTQKKLPQEIFVHEIFAIYGIKYA